MTEKVFEKKSRNLQFLPPKLNFFSKINKIKRFILGIFFVQRVFQILMLIFGLYEMGNKKGFPQADFGRKFFFLVSSFSIIQMNL
jgi:hypothetical protein